MSTKNPPDARTVVAGQPVTYHGATTPTRADLRAEVYREAREDILRQRGIDHPESACARCQGLGTYRYSHGSTWRGGVGTCNMPIDICDVCWGSGRKDRPWLDLRTLEADVRRQVAERAVDVLARTAGAELSTARESVREIIAVLDKMTRARKTSFWTAPLANGLANVLRRAIGEVEVKLW